MDNQPTQDNSAPNPRRRRKSRSKNFREVYLPFILVAVAVLAIIGIVAAVASGSGSDETTKASSSTSTKKQAEKLLTQAEELAASYDYEGALKVLNGFKGNLKDYPEIEDAIASYTTVIETMVTWKAGSVYDLSFHTLIADLEKALSDKTYGKSGNGAYNKNFITIDEFSTILQKLYDSDYVLVSFSDLYEYDETAKTYTEKELKLPAGKKPIMLTETHCNYYTYMSSCYGFATKLCYNSKEGFYNEMATSDGKTLTGAYDLVPILEAFIKEHPTFSYKGARATLALTGYDGIFGYRITSTKLSTEDLEKECADAKALIQALRDAGYTIACNSYDNIAYTSVDAIRTDLQNWASKITPIIGQTDIIVFARESNIGTSYSNNQKFDLLYENGFRYFSGISSVCFSEISSKYVRHNRLMVTGYNLSANSSWFKDILSVDGILNSARGKISS